MNLDQFQLVWLASFLLGASLSALQVPIFDVSSESPESSRHACVINTLLTDPFPQPESESLWKNNKFENGFENEKVSMSSLL